MLCACMTVTPWSMIQPSKAGSDGTHGVENPQPIDRMLSGALEHRRPDVLASGEVGAATERGEDLRRATARATSAPPRPITQ